MKAANHFTDRKSAFTLIEILIVISIIAILAGLCLAAYKNALDKAHGMKAKNAMAGLIIAIKGYQTDYNRYPLAAGKTDDITVDTSGADGIALLKSLLANDVADNPNRTKFYEPSGLAKNSINGYDAATGALFDPWGSGYRVVIDYDKDGRVETPYPIGDGAAEIPFEIIIYTPGPNRSIDDTTAKTDDLKSW